MGNLSRMNDYTSHYDAWIAYLKSTAYIPPFIDNAFWPFRTSVAYADAMPIFAIIFKSLASFFRIEKDFQFFSAVSLINNLSTIAALFYLSSRLKLRQITLILLSLVLLMTPVMTQRILIHEALSVHSVVIWSVILGLLRVKSFVSWCILLFVSIGIHPYFVPMILPIMTATFLSSKDNQWIDQKIFDNLKSKYVLIRFILVILLIVVSSWVFGLGINNSSFNVSNQIWDMNLLALVDPQETSQILPPLPINMPYEWEGYCYLGIGLGILATVFLADRYMSPAGIRHDSLIHQTLEPSKLLYLAVSILALYALGPNIHIGQSHVISLDFILVKSQGINPYAFFRSTGRYIWPLYYMIVIFLIVNTSERKGFFRKIAVLSVVFYLIEVGVPYLKKIDIAFDERLSNGQQIYEHDASLSNELKELLADRPRVVSFIPGLPKAESVSMYSISRSLIKMNIVNNFMPFLARYPEGWFEMVNQNPEDFLRSPAVSNMIKSQNIAFLLPSTYSDLLPRNLYISGQEYILDNQSKSKTLELVRYQTQKNRE